MSHRVLLVGLGQVGMGYDFDLAASEMVLSHANAFVGHPDFKVVGGVDPDPKACARFLVDVTELKPVETWLRA